MIGARRRVTCQPVRLPRRRLPMAQRKSGSTAQGCGCLAFIALLVIGGISWAWGEVFGSHPAASSAPQQAVATQASDTPGPPEVPCGKKPWPRPVPRRAIGQTLARASASDLRCFNLGAAYAPSGRNIINASANAAHRWRIVRISPVPGTLVKAGTELTLRLKLAHPPAGPAAPSPPAVSAPAASPAGCYPLSDEGTCYEPGEYCRDSDQGMTGVAGDGESIICEDNDGLRWEPTG
jgi:hypothetical protein